MTRLSLRLSIKRLALTEMLHSICPRTCIATKLHDNMIKMKIPKDDHLFVVFNDYPEKLVIKKLLNQ